MKVQERVIKSHSVKVLCEAEKQIEYRLFDPQKFVPIIMNVKIMKDLSYFPRHFYIQIIQKIQVSL